MANLKSLIVNGVSRFIGKVFIKNSQIVTINGVEVTENPKFTDTTNLESMTGTLGVAHGGTGKTSGVDAANYLINSLTTGSATPTDNDYYVSQYAGGGSTTATYHRRPVSALWTYIKGKIDANGAYTKPGTVTSVRVQATSPVTSSVNTEQTSSLNTTIALADNYGDTKNPYSSKTAKYVLAAPADAAGVPSFRALTNADVGLENVGNYKAVGVLGGQGLTNTEKLNARTNLGLGNAALKNVNTAFSLTSESDNVPTVSAVVNAINSAIAASDAMVFKGTLGTGGNPGSLPVGYYHIGWTYRVIEAGTYAGNQCQIGDLVIALISRSGSGMENSDWTVAQTNIDGAITKAGGIINGSLTIDNELDANSANIGSLVVNDDAVFNNNLRGNLIGTIDGYTVEKNVPSNAVFTDTVTTVNTTGNGNSVTEISASNGALTVVKGATFLTSHQDISGKVNKSGDTMTGPLILQNTNNSASLIVRPQNTSANYGIIGFNLHDIPNIPNTWFFYHDIRNNKLKISHRKQTSSSANTYFYVDSEDQNGPNFRVGGDLMIGHPTTESEGCKMRYNTSTQSLDFIFS